MEERFAANIDCARILIDALRDAIENTVAKRAKPRLLLLLEAIDGELRQLTSVDAARSHSATH